MFVKACACFPPWKNSSPPRSPAHNLFHWRNRFNICPENIEENLSSVLNKIHSQTATINLVVCGQAPVCCDYYFSEKEEK